MPFQRPGPIRPLFQQLIRRTRLCLTQKAHTRLPEKVLIVYFEDLKTHAWKFSGRTKMPKHRIRISNVLSMSACTPNDTHLLFPHTC